METIDRIREAYQKARAGYQVQEIAAEIGTTSPNLRWILRSAEGTKNYPTTKRSPYLRKLNDWLIEKGYLKDSISIAATNKITHVREDNAPGTEDIMDIVRALNALASYLTDPNPSVAERLDTAFANLSLLRHTVGKLQDPDPER